MQINVVLHVVKTGQFRRKIIIRQFELWHFLTKVSNYIANSTLHYSLLIAHQTDFLGWGRWVAINQPKAFEYGQKIFLIGRFSTVPTYKIAKTTRV